MSPFQAQFPLSRKKFTKKMISRLPDSIIYSIILGVLATLASYFIGAPSEDLTFGGVVAGVLSAAVVVFIVLMGIYAWYYKTYIRLYFYEGGDNFITIKKGVFAPKEIHVQYQKIQDVYVDQDILDRVIGLYDVHIASATGTSGMEAHIDGVDEGVANGLKEFFLAKIQGASLPQTPMQGATPDAPIVAQFSSAITSETHPIQPGWLPMTLLGLVFSSGLYGVLIAGYMWLKSTDDEGGTFQFFPIFLGVVVVAFILQGIYMMIWKGNYRFSFNPEYIQFHTGVLSMSERHLPYKSVQDVSVNQSLLERFFGLASVKIENAAQTTIKTRYGSQSVNMGVVLVGQTPASAAAITEELKRVILTKNSSQMGV